MSEATDMLAAYKAAELAVLNGQSYSIGGRSLTRANLSDIQAGRQYWQSRVNAESAASSGGSALYSVADFTE